MLFVSSPGADAALLAYEGFDYPTSTLAQGNGGSGFSTGWRNNVTTAGNSSVDITAGSLVFPTGVPYTTVGNKVEDPTGDAGFRTLTTGLDMSVTEDYFVSFLWRRPTANQFAGLSFFSGATEQVYFGSLSGQTAFQIAQLGNSATPGPANSQLLNTTYFVVGKIQANATGFDQAFLKIYQEGDTIDLTETTSYTITGAANENLSVTLDSIRIDAGDDYGIDEIRIGETWADVIPEPSSAGLLLLAFAGLAVRKRNR